MEKSMPPALTEQMPTSTCDIEVASAYTSSDGHKPKHLRRKNPAVLIKWIQDHNEHPYPTKAEKGFLVRRAGMTYRQLNDWFANARRNIKKKGYSKWKKKHSTFSSVFADLEQGVVQFTQNPCLSSYPRNPVPTSAVGISPHVPSFPPGTLSYFTANQLTMMPGIGGTVPTAAATTTLALAPGPGPGPGLGPGGAAAGGGVDETSSVMMSPPAGHSYYSPYVGSLTFSSPTYSTCATNGGADSTHVHMASPTGQPVLDGSSVQQLSNTQTVFKFLPNQMVPQQLGSHHHHHHHHHGKMYKTSLPSPTPLSQLSTGSSPYSDTTSPGLFGFLGPKTDPESSPPVHLSGSAQLYIQSEMATWNHVQADNPKIGRGYYNHGDVSGSGRWGSGSRGELPHHHQEETGGREGVEGGGGEGIQRIVPKQEVDDYFESPTPNSEP